jgi:hypothetical protein
VSRETNVCEHADHPAPHGKRFCSYACETCEINSFGRFGCDGLCERIREDEPAPTPTKKEPTPNE